MENNELFHTGVLGMRWGHRKASSGSTNVDAAKNHIAKFAKAQISNSEDYNKTSALRKKKVNMMSNAELKTFNERVQLEKTYAALKKGTPNPAEKFMKDFLANSAKQLLTAYLTKHSGDAISFVKSKVPTK